MVPLVTGHCHPLRMFSPALVPLATVYSRPLENVLPYLWVVTPLGAE